MNVIFRGCIRHTGYASLVLAGLCVFAESVMPAFVTPYFNPYALAVFGLMMSVVGARGVSGSRIMRCVVGSLFVAVVGLSLWFSFGDSSVLFVAGGITAMIAFFFTSVYALEV